MGTIEPKNVQASAPPSETERSSTLPALRPAPQPIAPKRRWWIWGMTGVFGLGLAAVVASQIWMGAPPVVATETAALAPVTRVLAVNGRVAALSSVAIRPVVTGTIISLPVAEGDEVAEGQTLVQIDPMAQNAIVRQAVAGLDAALVTRQQATEAYERAVSLGANVARTVVETAAHSVELATEEVARQTAGVDQALIGLENHTLRAPLAGTILTLDAEMGQLATPTTTLLTLANLGSLLVEADVDEAYATQVARGQPVILRLAGETANRDGHVSFVSARVDAATGGLAIKMDFDAPVSAPVGLTVTANIIVEQRDAALSVPRTALRDTGGGMAVFVVKDGTAQLHPVTVVDWPAARLIVTAGLTEGDAVIADATEIVEGQAVAVEQP
ncbi:efflux RND transporter periplasmic adaptor subunit [Pseudorhodobacter ferrugineus]|uniref:efflux RND transporter periplasmic adaptor subunit n=1 Tax=Pseudorhodobacter ferrugineus TaxID=77008 RepID=UPI00041FEA5E|nr:efflux RND transporter periplasmic adaptor subunit [Pseudorhodobacter ferrugineus]